MPHMYILECDNGKFYTGSPRNLQRRLGQHFCGEGANFTRKHKPVRLVYTEAYERVQDAFYREKQIQNWSHAKKKALIEQRFLDLQILAECRNQTHWTLSKPDPDPPPHPFTQPPIPTPILTPIPDPHSDSYSDPRA